MHGLGEQVSSFYSLCNWIKKAYPGTETYLITVFQGKESWASLLRQVPVVADFIRKTVQKDPQLFENGYNLVCHSQGALICRCLVEYMDDHAVHTLISMAGPQMGAWGDHWNFNAGGLEGLVIKADLSGLIYSQLLQATNSVANLWNDPLHQNQFLHGSKFLAIFNGLTDDVQGNARRKQNFIRLQKACFFVGNYGPTPYEGGIEPWQSGVFGYYKPGSITEYNTMYNTTEYINDTFGLKTLEETGRLVLGTPDHVAHWQWVGDSNVARQWILPHLGA
jgi:hypothetical protein